ncbi:MAG: FdhF/YdeP family oxidoreductase, partial [Bacteroidales bacterium]|nr:FdhF/YdeP family oxidoreductase [Bacteroidales bacterium]
MTLTFAEQLVLLTVDPVTGRLYPVPENIIRLTLAGALLFDASFRGLINDDWEKLTVLKSVETGNLSLDETIRCLQMFDGTIPLEKALALVASHGSTLHRMVWNSMETRGLLVRKKKELILTSRKQKLYTPDLPLVIEAHQRIRNAILLDEVPDYQSPALISLIVAGGLTRFILNPEEELRFKEKISWLAGLESLGREIIRSIGSIKAEDLDKEASAAIGLNFDGPKTFAGGVDSVISSLSYLYKETGINRSRKIIYAFNQEGGFECPGCAWPNPDCNRSHFEFCESGAKNLSSEATTKQVDPDFFQRWSVHDLRLTSPHWLEQQGRLTHPMLLDENESHYKPVTWEVAFHLISAELNSLNSPNEAVFYASGRTSIEAAFLYQLFARTLGTNNLPNSANLCHEPSGKALTMSLGCGKTSVTLDDFQKANAIFILGHNPGSNHPRMLSSLLKAARIGCRIVAVNPMPEASLMGFADPQEAGSYLGKQTRLADLYIQPRSNGDMAFIRGMAKALLEEEDLNGGVLDHEFILSHTSGFEAYRNIVQETSWEDLITASGVEKAQIIQAAEIYMKAENVIASWCLGITHHLNSVETIREIVNLLLLRGNIGKPGSGALPVRGHSNVQGIRTAGVGENMPESFLNAMEQKFSVPIPRKPGLSVVPAIVALAEEKAKILISLGGNLASAAPDTAFTEEALQRCRLTVMISTKLNRSHLITGKRALILPCLTRSEEDLISEVRQKVSIEDAMGKIGFSSGCLSPASTDLKSEVSIIAGLAEATLGNKPKIDWQLYAMNYQAIRSVISETIPALI